MADNTRCERAARLRERRLAEGQKKLDLWAPGEEVDALKAAYPGPYGGVNWRAVIAAALAHADHHPEAGQ
jgi:hypothetical protein